MMSAEAPAPLPEAMPEGTADDVAAAIEPLVRALLVMRDQFDQVAYLQGLALLQRMGEFLDSEATFGSPAFMAGDLATSWVEDQLQVFRAPADSEG